MNFRQTRNRPEKDVFKALETKSKAVFSRTAVSHDIERLKHSEE